MEQIIIYPGSFDPITNGHVDIIARASLLFDKIIVAITQNNSKKPFIDLTTRVEICSIILSKFNNVEVLSFDNLLVDFVRQQQAKIILRGIRAVSDFEYEFSLAGMNRKLDYDIETIFMTPSEEFGNISSTLVREVALLGGDIKQFVPSIVNELIINKIAQ